ncbi:MAG TPA: FKBP-type peptidyl-prolyl cis-trans isomerase [Hyphomicrobium sp.]|jgi:FKBP-type peptidyl-prolyl cis-trans isomerase|uniref:FKBP-type peptidyl-prolyl cis-trans isomerase n=1 Tax=Hyphomicrobium sp. TaxID=82 RepID=UPI002C70CEA8|nr:FKBP-type peptidyl-prolyl cis-trans isomerase [Hyphomicrobium sp.]HVE02778.1 FKBP-type peptidyl-prolyl cis-trans isomerase [Rhizomicrobium sp.]HXE02940.1 FKBP-type peptidyl-prolyl cis-trans isomerase [Hyphomicrobium sp.]
MNAKLALATLAFATLMSGFNTQTKADMTYDLTPQSNQKFLAENARQPGVVTTASGLQYKVLTAGHGKQIHGPDDTVTVTYKGWTIDGHVFDQTESGRTASFPAGRLIRGWVEALKLMHEGDEWQLVIPSKLGYGEAGAGADIGPNQTLVFDMKLISVAHTGH